MQFNSLVFLPFFAVVLLAHNLRLPWAVKKVNLLWLSYLFYAAWNPPFVVLLWISTVVDWRIGKWLHAAEGVWKRRGLLILSLCVNLGMLSYFKYGDFLAQNFALFARSLGIEWHPPPLDIVLPVGISFYTFQTLSYTLDIFNKRLKPWHSFLDYALFVTFFPQLVAGPIVRAREFLPQCTKPPTVTASQLGWGAYLFVIGLFEKVVLADGILAPRVEAIFDGTTPPSPVDGWIGCFGFACQVFCDFSGYSLCALGVAKCLGFNLPVNFRFPLASIGYRHFWRRWHISLSSWLRDYVYGSLRGATPERTVIQWAFNILVTWGLIGLWHGAGWRFLIWGLFCGLLLVLDQAARSVAPQKAIWTTRPLQFCFAFLTFSGFSLSMLIFRSPDLDRFSELALAMLGQGIEGQPMILSVPAAWLAIGTSMALFLSHWFMRHSTLEEVAARCSWPVKSAAVVLMLALVVLIQAQDRAFVYFQF